MDRRRAPRLSRRLTDRQALVLDLVAAGKENKEIAFELCVSEQAVKDHVSRLLDLLSVSNRAGLGGKAATMRFVGTFDIDPHWLQFLFQHAPMHVAVVSGPEHRFIAVNNAFRMASGGREIVGLTHREAFPERESSRGFLDEVYRTGVPFSAVDLPRRFVRVPGGPLEDGQVTVVLQPLPNADGTTGGIAIFSLDTTPPRA